MNKRITIIVLFIAVLTSVFSQEYGNSMHTFEAIPDTGKVQFRGMFGYTYSSGEIVKVDTNFFKELFNNNGIPTVNPQSVFQIGTLGMMFNRLYLNLSYSYTFDKSKENDSLKSSLRQSSFSVSFGYNLFRKKYEWVKFSKKDSALIQRAFSYVVSPYIGIKSFRFRHITSNKEKNVSFQHYLERPGYDLRIIQYSIPIGINFTFNFHEYFSFGFYASYLHNINKYPVIKSPQNRINKSMNLPVKNFYFGIGCGIGFNYFYRRINKNISYDDNNNY